METGIYIRVKNKNILLEDLSYSDRYNWLQTLDKESLIRVIDRLCNVMKAGE